MKQSTAILKKNKSQFVLVIKPENVQWLQWSNKESSQTLSTKGISPALQYQTIPNNDQQYQKTRPKSAAEQRVNDQPEEFLHTGEGWRRQGAETPGMKM